MYGMEVPFADPMTPNESPEESEERITEAQQRMVMAEKMLAARSSKRQQQVPQVRWWWGDGWDVIHWLDDWQTTFSWGSRWYKHTTPQIHNLSMYLCMYMYILTYISSSLTQESYFHIFPSSFFNIYFSLRNRQQCGNFLYGRQSRKKMSKHWTTRSPSTSFLIFTRESLM